MPYYDRWDDRNREARRQGERDASYGTRSHQYDYDRYSERGDAYEDGYIEERNRIIEQRERERIQEESYREQREYEEYCRQQEEEEYNRQQEEEYYEEQMEEEVPHKKCMIYKKENIKEG